MGCRGKRDGVAITCGVGLRLNVLINSHLELESAVRTQDFAQNLRDTMQVRNKEETSERVSKQARDLLRTRARERTA